MGVWARFVRWLSKARIGAYWRGDPRTHQRIYVPEHWDRRIGHREPMLFHHGTGGGGGGAATPHDRPVLGWPMDFPPIVSHVSVRELHAAASAPGEVLDRKGDSAAYRDAKAGRSDEAALRVVRTVVDPEKAMALVRRFPDAILLPVHAEELEGPNVLPVAYASHLQALTGLPVDDMIVQSSRVFHTRGRALDRLVSMPTFAGPVQTTRPYLLVDDVAASGSTLSALHRYIRGHGGRVVGATVLAVADHPSSGSGAQLAQTPETAAALRLAFDACVLRALFLECEIDLYPEELTNSEACNLLALRTVDAVRNRMLAARQAAAARQHAAASCKKRELKKSCLWSTPAYLDERGRVRLGKRPAPPASPPAPSADPPRERLPFSLPIPPGATRIHIKGTPTAAQALILHHELFPAAGTYLLTKATPMAGIEDREALDQWEEWFLRALEDRAREQFGSSQEAIWDVLDELLRRRGVPAPSMIDAYELHRTLFDLSHASTARMVGLRLPDEVRARLEKLGWTDIPPLDFPALAFRLAMISQRLMQQPPVTWTELVQLADAVPLSSVERAAVDIARSRAGMYLRPIYDASGQLWQIERELKPLRRRVAHAIEHRIPVREAARLHGNAQRLDGIQRDAQRTIVTEIAEARGQAAWQAVVKSAPADERFFRQTAANACRGCYRLLKNPDGTPRLFTRAELEAGEAQGVNRGNWREWHLRAGPLHPQCRCGPVSRYHAEMADIFADRAPTYAAEMERLGVFREAA